MYVGFADISPSLPGKVSKFENLATGFARRLNEKSLLRRSKPWESTTEIDAAVAQAKNDVETEFITAIATGYHQAWTSQHQPIAA